MNARDSWFRQPGEHAVSQRRVAPAVRRRSGSRVPHGTTRFSRLTRFLWPESPLPRQRQATRQHIHGGVLVAVEDEPTARTDMRPHAERLAYPRGKASRRAGRRSSPGSCIREEPPPPEPHAAGTPCSRNPMQPEPHAAGTPCSRPSYSTQRRKRAQLTSEMAFARRRLRTRLRTRLRRRLRTGRSSRASRS
jgi:hypothetical protein